MPNRPQKQNMKTTTRTENWRKIAIAIVCVITFFANNDVIKTDIMESRNIITAREMVYDGHWMVPTMNGELRLEKPPLPTWLTAIAEIVSPDSIAVQRGMAGLAALLLAFYFWKFARRALHTDPFVATLLLCTCYNVILMGRTASWDIFCHAFMMGGIYHLARGLSLPPCHQKHFIAAGVFTGLSIMSKGPVSLYALLLPFAVSYYICFRPQTKGKRGALTLATVIAVIIGTWWFVYIHLSQAEALAAVVSKESGSWINHNVRPWWYYWKFFLETGVWSLLLLTAIVLPLADRKRRRYRPWLFSLGWLAGSLLLLSLMPEKKSRYLLPLLIPACYLMGCLMDWWRESLRNGITAPAADKWCFRINTLLIATVVTLLPVAAFVFVLKPGYVSVAGWTAFSAGVIAIATYLINAAIKLRPMRLTGGVTVLFVAAECFAMPAIGYLINNPDMKSIAETKSMKTLEGLPFYRIDTEPLRIELVYAAGRKIRPIAPEELKDSLPCVLLTRKPIRATLADSCLEGIDITDIGRFDDNRRPKTNRRYSDEFIYHVSLLKRIE